MLFAECKSIRVKVKKSTNGVKRGIKASLKKMEETKSKMTWFRPLPDWLAQQDTIHSKEDIQGYSIFKNPLSFDDQEPRESVPNLRAQRIGSRHP